MVHFIFCEKVKNKEREKAWGSSLPKSFDEKLATVFTCFFKNLIEMQRKQLIILFDFELCCCFVLIEK